MKLNIQFARLWDGDKAVGAIQTHEKFPNVWRFYSYGNDSIEFLVDALDVNEAHEKVEKILNSKRNNNEKIAPQEKTLDEILGFTPIPSDCELYEASDNISERQKFSCQLAEFIANREGFFASEIELRDCSNGRGKYYHFNFAQTVKLQYDTNTNVIYKGAVDVYSLNYIVVWFEKEDETELFSSIEDAKSYLHNLSFQG